MRRQCTSATKRSLSPCAKVDPDPQVEGAQVMPANPLGVALRNRRAGHHTLVWARPDLQAPENFTLTSPAFDHGAPIPEKHRGRLLRANISPALNWTQPQPAPLSSCSSCKTPTSPSGSQPPTR